MTDIKTTDIELAEVYASEYGFCSGCKNINSVEANRELVNAYLAGLKARLNIRSCQNCRHNNKSCPNDGSCNHYSKWESYKNPQLTKAKEIIRDLLGCLYSVEYDRVSNLEEAEQFLKDSEEQGYNRRRDCLEAGEPRTLDEMCLWETLHIVSRVDLCKVPTDTREIKKCARQNY